MPYKSAKQRAWMHIHEPEIAKRWDAEYSNNKEDKSLSSRIKKLKKDK